MRTSYWLSLALADVCVCVGAFAQASFDLSNGRSATGQDINAPVYDWAGNLLAGPDWRAELYGGAQADSLSPAVDFSRGLRIPSFFTVPGYFRRTTSMGGDLVVWDVPAYGSAWLQVRVWSVELGATYEDAVARGLGGYGQSFLFYARGGDPGVGSIPSAPGPLIGLQSFSVLRIVPEPSAWLLLALGMGGLTWSVGRNKRSFTRQE